MARRASLPRVVAVAAITAITTVAAAAACSSPLTVPAAPDAANPACADVVLALPRDLDGMSRLETGSQATAAWGERSAPVVLRCGVDPPPPTTDPCVTADDGTISVDWVAVQGEPEPDGAAPWTFTTYGREPAVEVQVPSTVTRTRSTSFLIDLGPAVARVAQTRSCL